MVLGVADSDALGWLCSLHYHCFCYQSLFELLLPRYLYSAAYLRFIILVLNHKK